MRLPKIREIRELETDKEPGLLEGDNLVYSSVVMSLVVIALFVWAWRRYRADNISQKKGYGKVHAQPTFSPHQQGGGSSLSPVVVGDDRGQTQIHE